MNGRDPFIALMIRGNYILDHDNSEEKTSSSLISVEFIAQFPLLLSTVGGPLGAWRFLPSHSVLKTQFSLAVLQRTPTDIRHQHYL